MNIDLSGKTAFVTGGSKGIGKAIAETLADCGANVGVMARGKEELDAAVAALNPKHPGRVLAVQGDVSSYEQISAADPVVPRTVGALSRFVPEVAADHQPGQHRVVDRCAAMSVK